MNILDIGLSQLYLSQSKIEAIEKWFTPDLSNFDPLPVHDFNEDELLTLTDGHTRLFVAWKNGLEYVPVYMDNCEIVTNPSGQKLYTKCINLCKENGAYNVSCLRNRILEHNEYKPKWIDFCESLSVDEN